MLCGPRAVVCPRGGAVFVCLTSTKNDFTSYWLQRQFATQEMKPSAVLFV